MIMENKGVLTVLKRNDEYKIVYVEKGEELLEFSNNFKHYEEACEYRDTNVSELDKMVTKEKARILEEEEKRRKLEEESIAKKEEEKAKKREQRKEKVKSFFKKTWVKVVSIVLAIVLLLTGGHFIGKGISDAIKNKNSNKPGTSQGSDDNTPDVTIDIEQDIENIITYDDSYSTENVEKVVTEFAKPYVSNNVSITTEDLLKFASIVNIDKLVEENPEFARSLFETQSAEEYLNDAAKTIGVTYMYNHNVWEANKNTEKFIWISASIPDGDPQKQKMVELEGYVTRIANAVKEGNKEDVNKITYELIESLTMPDGSLNAMDDGVEFGAQLYFALINNSIARNYLNQEYRDYFNTRASAEQNVSNIFAVYNGCVNNDVKVRTRG